MEKKEKLHAQLDDCSEFILNLEEKVFKANKTALELLK